MHHFAGGAPMRRTTCPSAAPSQAGSTVISVLTEFAMKHS